jgi:predicted ATPase
MFDQSASLARRHDALAWELRSVTSLACLWQLNDKRRQAEALLAPVYGRFTEGLGTADLLSAKHLLEDLAFD